MKKIFFWGGFFIILCFLFPGYSHASLQDIVINELMWTGSETSSSDEWIELRNLTGHEIDLSGYKIKYSDDREMISISSGKILANGYFLIANSSCDHNYSGGESILNIIPDYIDSGVSLSNSNLQIKLVDSADRVIDIAGNGEKPLAGDNDKKYSMERNDIITDGTLSSSWHTSTESINLDTTSNSQATPSSANSPPVFQSPTNLPADLEKFIDTNNCLEAISEVTNIVDGDTIDIDLNGEFTRVRLLGINAPDSAKYSDFKIDEPFYNESKQFLIDNILNKEIKVIVTSDSNEQYDSYDRLLSLIVLDQEIINISSLKKGLSKTYYLDNPILISAPWANEEKIAQQSQIGLWRYYGEDFGLYINEIMPNPKGKDEECEWIELLNSGGKDINLSNWFIDDSEHGSDPYLFPENTVIRSGEFLVIKITESNISLNNSSDSVRLFSPDLNIYDEISYDESAKEEISYMRDGSGLYRWTKIPTPGAVNQYYDPDKPEYEKIEKISYLNNTEKEAYVEIEGYANTKPHQVSEQYFYIEDDTGGVQIYNYDKEFPDVNIGQKIKVFGQLSDSKILRVKIDSIDDLILSNEQIIFDPQRLFPEDIKNYHIGRLVSINGEVSKLSGQTFYITHDINELKIQIRGPTVFKRPDISRGDILEITGVLYQSSYGNITLLPRFLSDISIIKRVKEKSFKNPINVQKISDLQYLSEDDHVRVRGIVNCLPGMLGKKYFYIEDESRGVEIYSHYEKFPNIEIGDYIEIVGVLSASKRRIKTYSPDDFKIISKKNEINPVIVNKNTSLEENYGKLINIKGLVISKKGNNITISVDGIKFTLNIKDISGLKPSILKIGDNIDIFGVVSEYRGDYRIHPRFIEDIYYTRKAKLKTKKSEKSETKVKSFSSKKYLPRIKKFLVKKPQNKYNIVTIRLVVKTIIIVLQFILLVLIIEWLCKKQLSQKI